MDIVGIKLLKKLADVISKGVGTATKPYFIRRNADAVAYEMRTLADAKAYEIEKITDALFDSRSKTGHAEFKSDELALLTPADVSAEKLSLPERAQSRASYQAQVEQENIEQVTRYATEQVVQAEEVSDEPVDDDWIKRFFGYAKDVSNEDMQRMWGKILAGEVVKPGSFSLKTLSVLRNLSQTDATMFTKISQFSMLWDGNHPIIFKNLNFLKERFGIVFGEILTLQDAGLIIPENELSLNIGLSAEDDSVFIKTSSKIMIAQFSDDPNSISMPIISFSAVGRELLSLLEIDFPDLYWLKLSDFFLGKGASVIHADVSSNTESGYENPTQVTKEFVQNALNE